MESEKKKKPVIVLKVTATYWVRIKDKLQYEAKAKDIFGSKYTFTIDSKEPPPVIGMDKTVTKNEFDRIQFELNDVLKKAYNNVLEKIEKIKEENELAAKN